MEARLKVCMLAFTLPVHSTGGMEYHTIDLARGLAKRGVDVTIITGKHPKGINEESAGGVKIQYIGEDANARFPFSYWKNSVKKFIELEEREGFDLIHSQSGAGWFIRKDRIDRRYRIPHMATVHGTSLGEMKGALRQGFSATTILKVIFYTLTYLPSLSYFKGLDAIIAVGKKVGESVGKEYFQPESRIHVILNGVDTDRFSPMKKPPELVRKYRLEGKAVLLAACRLHKEKGVQHIINAMPKLLERDSRIRLLVVGSGPYKSELENLAKRLVLEGKVIFAGEVSNEKIAEYYNLCDVFVFPTIRHEGLPLVLLEAMSCGKPVVVSRIGGIVDVVSDGVDGLLVEPGDEPQLLERILRIIKDKDLSEKLGRNARKRIETAFSKDRMVEDTIKVYEGVLKRK